MNTPVALSYAALWVMATSFPAAADEVLFDPPEFLQAWTFAAADSFALPVAVTRSSDGTVWLLVHDDDSWGSGPGLRLVHFDEGQFTNIAVLPPETVDLVWSNGRLRERTDGKLCLVQATRVWVFERDGTVVDSWSPAYPGQWHDADVDADGNVFGIPADEPYDVDVYDPTGLLLGSWDMPSSHGFALLGSVGVGADGRIFVLRFADCCEASVLVCTASGTVLETWEHDSLGWPNDRRLWVLPSGTLYVLPEDPWQFTTLLLAFSPDGIPLCEWDWRDPLDARHRFTPGLATEDPDGRLLLATYSWQLGDRLTHIYAYAPLDPGNMQPGGQDVPYSVDGTVPVTPVLVVHGNPFRSHAVFETAIPSAGHASLRIHDVSGKLVRVLLDGQLEASHEITWDARDAQGDRVPAGVYFVRFEAVGTRRTSKLVHLGH